MSDMENHDYEDWPVTEETRLSGKATLRLRGRLQPPTAQDDDEIYNPPAWRVCPECDGHRDILAGHPGTCKWCNGTGRIPIRYTPEQWTEAGGVLSDGTQVWVWIGDRWSEFAYNYRVFREDSGTHQLIIAIPGQPRPPAEQNKGGCNG